MNANAAYNFLDEKNKYSFILKYGIIINIQKRKGNESTEYTNSR